MQIRPVIALAIAAVVSMTSIVALPGAATAADLVTVQTVPDLQTAVASATADTVITLGDTFPQTLPATISLTSTSAYSIEINGAGKTLYPAPTGAHLTVNASGTGTITIQDLTLTLPAGSTATNGGLQLDQTGAGAVVLSGLDLLGLKTNAVVVSGSGTGALTITDSSFIGNSAPTASALLFTRTSPVAQTLIQRSTFDSNVGTSGGGYSGGAMRFEAGSQGTVTIDDSAFVDNKFIEGGSQPRGGAIALHNSNVQLHLDHDYFAQNTTASSTTPANADGGAVSSFNSTSNTSGSIFVSDSTFDGNVAQDDAAALFIEGRAPAAAGPFSARMVVENSTFINNVSGNLSGDSGGAIQASLRAEVTLIHNTFVNNTKSNNAAGVDVGGHLGVDGQGVQRPVLTATNNIFTLAKSVHTTYVTCTSNVGCSNNTSTITATAEAQVLLDVFGTATPTATANGTSQVAGDARVGRTTFPLTTVLIAPPLSTEATTAYQSATQATSLVADERGVPFKSTPRSPDGGSLEMDYVHFDAQTNGGSWSGISPSFPVSGTNYYSGDDASSGWYEVGQPGQTTAFPTSPIAPTGNTFIGWFTEPTGGSEITSAPAAQGQTYYAQFAAATFTVTFDSAGGSAVDALTDIPHEGLATKPADPTRDGYTFGQWTLDGVAYDFATPVTSDLTLIATWSPIPITLDLGVRDTSYTYGQLTSLSAQVRNFLVAGQIRFTVNGVDLATEPVVDGSARFAPTTHLGLDVGTYDVTANYSEDGWVTTAATARGTLTVRPATTSTSIGAVLTSSTATEATFAVSGSVSTEFGTTSTGTVTINAQGSPVSSALPLDAHGRYEGTVTVPFTAGTESLNLTAQHSGDLNHLTSAAEALVALPLTPPTIPTPPSVNPTPAPSASASASTSPDGLASTGSNGLLPWGTAMMVFLVTAGGLITRFVIRRQDA